MTNRYPLLVLTTAAIMGLLGCAQDKKLHDGTEVPLYRGQVVATPPGRPHFEPIGQDRWVYLTKARPGDDAEAQAVELKDFVGKSIEVEGLLVPGTGWIFNAQILDK